MAPESWQDLTLSRLGSFRNGVNFGRADEGNGLPVLKVKDFGDLVACPLRGLDEIRLAPASIPSDQLLADNDIVIIRSNGNPSLVGRSVLVRGVERPTTFSGFCIRFRNESPQSDSQFIAYYLRSPECRGRLTRYGSGTGIHNLNQSILAELPIKLPPLSEQQAIAGVLGALDDKIESNRRTSRTLEKLARAIFRAWFVDFEPVKAKAAGTRSFPSMPQQAFDALPTRLIPSELGLIPEGWEVRPLSNLCTLGRGASPRPINDYMNGEVPWVKIADATAANGPFLFETKEKLKMCGVEKSVNVSPGDLILSNSATCGLPVFVEFDGCIHDGWLYFKNLRSISNIYLYHVLIELTDHLVHIADGSVQKNLNTKLVGEQNVLVPTEPISAAFEIVAIECFAKIRLNGIESRRLATLRDYLLPKLLSGEVRVPQPSSQPYRNPLGVPSTEV